jgi:hypothetical protein
MPPKEQTDEILKTLKTLLIVQLLTMGVPQASVREIAGVSMNTVNEIGKKLPKRDT